VLEGILEVVFGVILFILFGGVIAKAMKEAGGGDDGTSDGKNFIGGGGGGGNALFGFGLGERMKGFFSHFGGGASVSSFGNLFLDDAATGGNNGYDEQKVRELLGKYILLVLLIAFLFLFVIPGFVEEYTKHMSVRATWLPHPLRSPRAVCIALVSAALGFATKENLQYVFSVGRSNYEGELALLGLRSLFPVHAICAGIQAVQMIRRDFQNIPLSLPKVLAPAVVLHGSFDFLQVAVPVLLLAYTETKISDIEIINLVVAGVITVAGAVYLFWTYHVQANRLLQGDARNAAMELGQVVDNDEDAIS